MGYRSTVVFGVKKSNSSKLDEILKEYSMTPDEKVSRDYKNYKMIKDKNGRFLEWERTDDLEMTIYKFEYIKWYSDYPEVLAIDKCIKDLYEEYEESTFLVALGEEGEIYSTIGEWHNFVGHVSELVIHEVY